MLLFLVLKTLRSTMLLKALKDGVLWKRGEYPCICNCIRRVKLIVSLTEIINLLKQSIRLNRYSSEHMFSEQVIYTRQHIIILRRNGIFYIINRNRRWNGEIDITEYDTENNTFTGTFKFNALNSSDDSPNEPQVVNFIRRCFL